MIRYDIISCFRIIPSIPHEMRWVRMGAMSDMNPPGSNIRFLTTIHLSDDVTARLRRFMGSH